MTQTERYVQWIPLPNVNGAFELDTVVDDEDGFHITLSNDTGRRLRVDFRSALAYRLTGRAILGARGLAGSGEIGDVLRGENGPFFTVEGSAWALDCSASAGFASSGRVGATVPEGEEVPLADEALTHYVFVLEGELIEVLCDEEPNIAWLNTLFGDAI